MFGLHDRLDPFQIAMRDGVTHRGEGLDAPRQGSVGVTEDGQRGLGQLAPKRHRHVLGYRFGRGEGQREQIGEFRQCSLGGHVEASHDTCSGETHAGGVDGTDTASEA